MKKFLFLIKEFVLDTLFPKFCLNCGREGSFLCQDCFSLLEVLDRQYCPFCTTVVSDRKTCSKCKRSKYLEGLYCAGSYDNFILKKLINQFKYEPYIKEISEILSSLIIAHFINSNNQNNFSNFILIPVPLYIKKLKQRGFNQAEEIAKKLSETLKIPLVSNCLSKKQETSPQVNLKGKEREENIKGVFFCQKSEAVKGRKILLVDDVLTTGSTMEECALTLKKAGAKEVWGVAVARG